MKKGFYVVLALLCMMLCVGCGKEKAAIPMDKIAWSLSEGLNEGHSYVYFQMTNNSDTPILGFQATFCIRDDASSQEREQFLHELQDSQGFDEAFMQTFLNNLTQNGGELTMTAGRADALQPGQTSELTQCYYMGGWTSKDLLYGDLFALKTFMVTYEKEGEIYEQSYDLASKTYTTQLSRQSQQ